MPSWYSLASKLAWFLNKSSLRSNFKWFGFCPRWEFVQYLLSTLPSSYDEHWIPVRFLLFTVVVFCCCSWFLLFVVVFLERLVWLSLSMQLYLWPGVKILFSLFTSLHTDITFWDYSGIIKNQGWWHSCWWSGGGAGACHRAWGLWSDQTKARERQLWRTTSHGDCVHLVGVVVIMILMVVVNHCSS